MYRYTIAFMNQTIVSFDYMEDIDLHKIDPTMPLVFDNNFINLRNVAYICKDEPKDYDV